MKYLYIIVLFFCVSCFETQKKDNLITLKVNSREIVPDFDFSELVEDSVRLVFLEGGEGKLIGEVTTVQIVGDTIYILDEISQSIFRYDFDGKFISKLSGKGRAHNEYVELIGNCFFVKDMNLHVIDKFGGKIIVYNKDNQFVKSIPTKRENGDQLFADFVIPNNNGNHLVASKSADFHFFGIDNEGKIGSKDISVPEFKKSANWKYGPAKDLISFSDNGVYVGFFGTDTIYNIHNGAVTPKYVVDFGADKASDELLSTEANLLKVVDDEIIGIQKMAFVGKYILLFYKVNKQFLVSIYSSDGELLGGPCGKFVYKDNLNYVELNSPHFTYDYSVTVTKPSFLKRFAKNYHDKLVRYKNGSDYLDYYDCAMANYDVDNGNPMLLIQKWKK